MKPALAVTLSAALFGIGCATSTIESRKAQAATAYAGFPAPVQKLVDQGEIQAGMDTNAVFIAWGRPAESSAGGSAPRVRTVWIYRARWVQKVPYWSYTPSRYGLGTYDSRLATFSREYVRAKVVFENDRVVDWRIFPAPDQN